ncbi:MAG: hypothetical protein HY427_01490 [Candidatus Levybacteria bacterium]|nr:hypothetical protein [Candidatus Levybacteria bacterium]
MNIYSPPIPVIILYRIYVQFNGYLPEYTKVQQDFYDILVSYYSALFEAVELLHLSSNKLNELSKGQQGKDKPTFSEYHNWEKKYKEKIEAYMSLAGKLNVSFQKLRDEIDT